MQSQERSTPVIYRAEFSSRKSPIACNIERTQPLVQPPQGGHSHFRESGDRRRSRCECRKKDKLSRPTIFGQTMDRDGDYSREEQPERRQDGIKQAGCSWCNRGRDQDRDTENSNQPAAPNQCAQSIHLLTCYSMPNAVRYLAGSFTGFISRLQKMWRVEPVASLRSPSASRIS